MQGVAAKGIRSPVSREMVKMQQVVRNTELQTSREE